MYKLRSLNSFCNNLKNECTTPDITIYNFQNWIFMQKLHSLLMPCSPIVFPLMYWFSLILRITDLVCIWFILLQFIHFIVNYFFSFFLVFIRTCILCHTQESTTTNIHVSWSYLQIYSKSFSKKFPFNIQCCNVNNGFIFPSWFNYGKTFFFFFGQTFSSNYY